MERLSECSDGLILQQLIDLHKGSKALGGTRRMVIKILHNHHLQRTASTASNARNNTNPSGKRRSTLEHIDFLEVYGKHNAAHGLQIEYSLTERMVERELIPMAKALSLGVTAWSPLANGVLTGKYHGHGSSNGPSNLHDTFRPSIEYRRVGTLRNCEEDIMDLGKDNAKLMVGTSEWQKAMEEAEGTHFRPFYTEFSSWIAISLNEISDRPQVACPSLDG